MSTLFDRLRGRARPAAPPGFRPAPARSAPVTDASSWDYEWTYGPERVVSSNLGMVAYNAPDKRLRVWFKNGGIYDYLGLNAYMYSELLAAPSKGKFLNERIKGTFLFVKAR